MAAVFACIVQPKVIEFNVSDQKLHRAQKDEELRSELDALKLSSPDAVPAGADGTPAPAAQWPGQSAVGPVLCHPGGGCRLLSRSASVSVASVGSAVCVFEGALTNVGSLAEDYTPLPEDEPTPAPAALSSAELMCHMYAKVGVEMLGLLRGSFTFVLYESKTSRVLAARDGGGRGPLFQARTAKGSLLLTNSSGLLEASGCTDKLEFQPGEFKYGWSATPRLYQPADHARLSRRSLDHSTSAHHQHHHHHHQGGSRNSSRRASLDHHHESPVGSPSASSGFMDGRHNRNHHNHHNGGGVISGSPLHAPLQQQQQPGPHPHRTYVVSAEEPRIVKAAPARQQQPAAAAPVAASPPTAGGAWTAVAPASASRGTKDKGQQGPGQENGGQGRGGSARGGGASDHQHQNRRRSSLDIQGAWRLGAGHGVSAAGSKQQLPQQQPANGEEQKPQQHQQQQKQQPTGPKQQQHPGAPNGGRGPKGRDGRPSLEGRTPTKQQQQTAASAQSAAKAAGSPALAPAAAAGPRVSGAGSKTLRVDAPEFVCNRSVPAAVPSVAVAAAVASAP